MFIKDLQNQIGNDIELVMFLKSVTKSETKGNPYYALTFKDKTGEVNARVWKEYINDEYLNYKGDFVFVKANVYIHEGQINLKVTALSKEVPNRDSIDLSDFIFSADKIEQLIDEVTFLVLQVENVFLSSVLKEIFGKRKIMDLFSKAQAGSVIHHNYVGGLIVHAVTMAKMALSYASIRTIYSPYRDKYRCSTDLLITGALLSDLGKLMEYESFPSGKRTVQGKLLGHVHLGMNLLDATISRLQFEKGIQDSDMALELKHIILVAHRDQKLAPKTIEAEIISSVDSLDSKVAGIESHYEKESDWSDDFTKKNSYYGVQFLKKGVLIDDSRE